MKVILTTSLFICFLVMSCSAGNITLFADGQTNYHILIASDPTAQESINAQILQSNLEEVSGILFPIQKGWDGHGNQKYIVVSHSEALFSSFGYKPFNESDQGYSIKTSKGHLLIFGKTEIGVRNGIYSFCKEFLKTDYLAKSLKIKQKFSSLEIPTIDQQIIPSFDIRMSLGKDANDDEYSFFHKNQRYRDDPANEWGNWGHTSFQLVPPKQYFQGNPTFYSLVDNQRVASQLCYSNSQVKNIVIERLKKLMSENPTAKYWNVTQEDNMKSCECDQCAAVNKEEGAKSGTLIRFVNSIAKEFPNKSITTLAYSYTQIPPKKTKLENNTLIILCTSGSYNRIASLKEQGFGDIVDSWSDIAGNVMIWDYPINYKHFLFPVNNLEAISDNIDLYKQKHLKGVFMQGNYWGGGAFDELKSYIIVNKLWNDKLDFKDIEEEFLKLYYGNAAPKVKSYLDNLKTNQDKVEIGLFDDPKSFSSSFFSNLNLASYEKLLSEARQLADDNEIINRVDDLRAALMYVKLRIYLSDDNMKTNMLKDKKTLLSIRESLNLLKEFKERNNVEFTGETYIKFADFLKGVESFLQRSDALLVNNKAYGKKISVKNPSSNIHAGDAALVDGISGALALDINSWVVFNSGSMDVTIDLGKRQQVKELSINFLIGPPVKMYEPDSFEVYISSDNINFQRWGSVSKNIVDQNSKDTIIEYLVTGDKKKVNFVKVVAKTKTGILGLDEIVIK